MTGNAWYHNYNIYVCKGVCLHIPLTDWFYYVRSKNWITIKIYCWSIVKIM